MEFADKCLNPTLKISRKDNSHILAIFWLYFKFLKRYNMAENSRMGEHFEKYEDK